MEERGEKNVYAYGETPRATWEEISRLAKIDPDDVFCDLGCGRGLLPFWTAKKFGCKAIGIDWIPTFILRAQLLAYLFGLREVLFFKKRMREVELQEITVVYLYTFHQDEEEIDFSKMRKGARVISVSEPLKRSYLAVTSSMKALYPWGETDVYIHERI
jgi:hypothetical protein